MSDQQLTVLDAAEKLGLSRFTLYTWIRDRRVAHTRLGDRAIRIPASEVRRLLKQGAVAVRPDLQQEHLKRSTGQGASVA